MTILRSVLLAASLLPAALMAAERNDVPSCYAQAKITAFKTQPTGRMLTVMVDQTTPLTEDLQRKAWAHIKGFVKPGDKLRLYSFSAYLEGHYTRLQFAGELERALDEKVLGNVPMMASRKLDRCLKSQQPLAWSLFGSAFAGAMGKSSSDIPRSEILFSINEISKDIRRVEDIDKHVILLMSDMLEYSDFSSFYASNTLREIDSVKELAKVNEQNLTSDLDGARVFVHGAAFVPNSNKNGYRSGKMIQSLHSFWSEYFVLSNASLEGFGTPELTATVE